MTSHTQPNPFSAAASLHGAASSSLALLEARQLRDGLATLLRAERTAAAEFLLALADFDRHRGWEPLGHASLFAFLNREFGLSKGAAYLRFTAARLLQRFPDVIEPLRDGRLCLSSVGELSRVLTAENLSAVLPRFFGCSSREAKEVTAALRPHEAPPSQDQVTRVVPPLQAVVVGSASVERGTSCPDGSGALALAASTAPAVVHAHELPLAHPARAAAPRDDVEPLTADLRRLHVTVSRRLLDKIDAARDGLSHALRGATTEQVLEAALDLLIEKQARARGQVKRPRATVQVGAGAGPEAGAPPPPPSPLTKPPPARRDGPREHVPAAVRRAVWVRDHGRCQWPLDSGGCCGSTHQFELDHLLPWARWGPPTVDGLRLLCHPHNLLAARLAFGARCMERYAGGRQTQRKHDAPSIGESGQGAG
jgi:hypothetical protein